MGKFDLDQKYDETQSKTYTLIDLIHEIITEHGETYETCVGAEYSVKCKNIKYKFKNKDKSGIIDKLNMYFNFDVEQLGKKSPQESFKMLQLLNYLYKLDKHKRIKKVEKENKSWEEQQEIDIIFLDMLNKPHIENINTTIPAKSRNGKVFENVRSDINKMVPEYIKMYKELIDINEGWQYFLRKMLNCIIENLGHDFTEVSTIKLKCIYEILQENIYFKIENISTQNISSRNIFETFWCIINTHPFLCRTYENEANKKNSIPESPTEEYIVNLKFFGNKSITWEIVDVSKEIFKKRKSKNIDENSILLAKRLLEFSLNCDNVTDKMINNYKFALKYVKLVANWFGTYMDYDFSSKININYLVAIIQEIIYLKENENENKIKNDYIGYNNKFGNLTAALKHPDSTNPLLIFAWQKRIENRIIANMGKVGFIKEKHNIENLILKIERFILSFRNIDDMKLVNEYCLKKAFESFPSDRASSVFADEFFTQIYIQMLSTHPGVEIAPDLKDSPFFKALMIEGKDKMYIVANILVTKINELFEKNIDGYETKIFDVKFCNYHIERNFKIKCRINYAKGDVIFLDITEKNDEKTEKRLSELGIIFP